MKITTSLLLSSLIMFSLYSQPGADTKKAYEFFDSIYNQVNLNQAESQRLIDQLTVSVLTLQKDANARFETKELIILLEKAKANNILKQKNIENIIEFDKDIDFKGKVLDYLNAFHLAYQMEFPKIIEILGDSKEDRFERTKNILLPRLNLIKEKEIAMKNSKNEFLTKYPVIKETSVKRTGANFEYVNLKDFKYTPAKIKNGTKIELLSFSGGEIPSEENNYYVQFIGIVKSTGDTVRILAPAKMQQYDFYKALRLGTFKNDLQMGQQKKTSENMYIIFNANQKETESGDFKTVFGTLTFDH